MRTLNESKLRDGIIFGDNLNHEYVYIPGSEIGVEVPMCVFETARGREDVSVDEALHLIIRYGLKPVKHPRLGMSSC